MVKSIVFPAKQKWNIWIPVQFRRPGKFLYYQNKYSRYYLSMLKNDMDLNELASFVNKLVTDKDVLIDVAVNAFKLLIEQLEGIINTPAGDLKDLGDDKLNTLLWRVFGLYQSKKYSKYIEAMPDLEQRTSLIVCNTYQAILKSKKLDTEDTDLTDVKNLKDMVRNAKAYLKDNKNDKIPQ
eukprot:CAMPEP_0168531114 /NCGR_PEP_ID=MMETSP0405-20121227/15191_1 /TAXON_ID=498012 /ORGANISM="Trichosphaerium sp, Strain Am-I-7 wt" /LENGTH=180 /DNA_ID=CAMNT_0008555727 /DNA_START=110 /DNA_END=649 /DNA_ORIENTATION=-